MSAEGKCAAVLWTGGVLIQIAAGLAESGVGQAVGVAFVMAGAWFFGRVTKGGGDGRAR